MLGLLPSLFSVPKRADENGGAGEQQRKKHRPEIEAIRQQRTDQNDQSERQKAKRP
jgi:hypothetical protein